MGNTILGHSPILLALILGPMIGVACDKKKNKISQDAGYGVPSTGPETQVYHQASNWCKLKKLVIKPAPKSAEAAIQNVLIAARTAGEAATDVTAKAEAAAKAKTTAAAAAKAVVDAKAKKAGASRLAELKLKADKAAKDAELKRLAAVQSKEAAKKARSDFGRQFLSGNRYLSSFWQPAVKHWARYRDKTSKEGPFPFRICTDDPRGKDRRITILSFDDKKSNPPMTLAKDAQGAWKIRSTSTF